LLEREGSGTRSGAGVNDRLTSVEVEDLACHEARRLKIEDRLDDLCNLTRVPDRLKSAARLFGLGRIHLRLDNAGCDGVHADTALGVFDGKRFGCGVEAAHRQRLERGGQAGQRVVNKARADLDNMAATLLFHLGDGELRHVEEADSVDAQGGGEVGFGIFGEGLGDEDAGIVDERVDAPEPRLPSAITLSAVFRPAMSPGTARTPASLDGLTDRAVAIT
jgi:hypothetical protein